MNKENRSHQQQEIFEKDRSEIRDSGPVTCLGMTFENDEKRREYFLEKLREKLKDPEFRKIEGFPIGEDEDILALSDPPYYTSCPNPFIEDFIRHYGKPYDPATDDYRHEPFATDVSEGKNDTVYKLHSYHTKVPYKSIIHFIEHFTNPGDTVLDAFCGSGMSAVASAMVGRNSISCDISPFSTFITHNYVHDNPSRHLRGIENLVDTLEDRYKDAIFTFTSRGDSKRIQFTVWSDVLICPNCSRDVLFWGNGVDIKTGKMPKEFPCPHCQASIKTLTAEKAHETYFDPNLSTSRKRTKRVPVLVNYKETKGWSEKTPDDKDLSVIQKYAQSIPRNPKLLREFIKGDMYRAGYHFGMTHVHDFFDQRVLCIAEDIRESLLQEYGNYGIFLFTSLLNRLSRMNRFIPLRQVSPDCWDRARQTPLKFNNVARFGDSFNTFLRSLLQQLGMHPFEIHFAGLAAALRRKMGSKKSPTRSKCSRQVGSDVRG